jgi:dienelactone hydrolase
MFDEPISVTIRARPGATARLALTLERWDGIWQSQATYRVPRSGRFSLRSAASLAGDYTGVDAMGLFWSARHVSDQTETPVDRWIARAHFSLVIDDVEVATADVRQHFLREGTSVRAIREQGVVGTLFEPPGRKPQPGLLVVGGSEGGLESTERAAAAYAAHGYAALAVAYFDPSGALAGIPRQFASIPLEYFEGALDWMRAQPTIDDTELGVAGASRGAELALLLASRRPEVGAVVAHAPSSVVWPGLAGPAWTEGGEVLPFLVPDFAAGQYRLFVNALNRASPAELEAASIPVENINAPVLLIAGNEDRLWPSTMMGQAVIDRLRRSHHPFADRLLSYDGTGHIIGRPYLPTTELSRPPGGAFELGGNPKDTAHAACVHWREVLRYLDRTLGAPGRATPAPAPLRCAGQ